MSISEIKAAISERKDVYWQTLLYKVKVDFEGDLVVKCIGTNGQQLIDESFDMDDFFIK